MAEVIYPKMAVIGCGLIGSSIVRAARAHGVVDKITVSDSSIEVCKRVAELDIADEVTADPLEAVRGADLVVLATPPGSIGETARACAAALKPGATLTDVGSVKGSICQALAEAAPKGVFVIPGHPIAGTEQSGPDAGFAELFHDRWTILTPIDSDDPAYPDAVKRLVSFWQGLRARVELMDERHHDLVLAVTSHLPHLIAYNIVGTADDLEKVTQGEVIKYSAGGFRDFTRIAASDPVMWRDVFLTNTDAVLAVLDRFQKDLGVLTSAIEQGDGDTLQKWFTHTRAIRRGIIDAGQETAETDFGRHHGHAPVSPDAASE